MNKTVYLFPGQGSQYKGMGKDLFPKYPKESQLASEILGYNLEELCLQDPGRKLVQTQYTQPALYVFNHLQYMEKKGHPDFLIGHSLGEYNALLAAGVYDFETGLRLVQKRGELMAAASGGSMAAVLGLSVEELKQRLQDGGYTTVDIANYNTPTQLVLSGIKEDVAKVVDDFSAQKIRIIPLNVSAPFHSRYMQPAVEEFTRFLEEFSFGETKIPVIANVTARPYENDNIAKLLSLQIASPVQWIDTIRFLMGQEASGYYEFGRGILTRMANEIRESCEPIEVIPPKVLQPQPLNRQGLASRLGSEAFRKAYGIRYSYMAGGMYRGIASKELVIRMAKAGLMGYLGTAGMSLAEITENIDYLQSNLTPEQPYGMNLVHNLINPGLEMQTVELFLEKGIRNLEAAAFMQMTESLACFHAKGLKVGPDGQVVREHQILAKVSRPEVAEAFMRPAPEKILRRLADDGKITEQQAELAGKVPVSFDICVEADSGGHTDGGVAMVLLPAIQRLARDIEKEYNYPMPIRVGLAGGIGTPQSAACAFIMGADFVMTGSINQCSVEAGTSNAVKDLLEDINVQDTAYAPAGDMFEIGAKVQVLRKGVLFPARANKLYNLYVQYNSLDDIPDKTIALLEKNYFKKSLSTVWEETKERLRNTGRAAEIQRAEQTPKKQMALVFRRYFGYSSRMAFAGDLDHKVNFQIHTGPAMGAFNQWVKGTRLESWRNRHVDEMGLKIMEEAAELLKNRLGEIVG